MKDLSKVERAVLETTLHNINAALSNPTRNLRIAQIEAILMGLEDGAEKEDTSGHDLADAECWGAETQ